MNKFEKKLRAFPLKKLQKPILETKVGARWQVNLLVFQLTLAEGGEHHFIVRRTSRQLGGLRHPRLGKNLSTRVYSDCGNGGSSLLKQQ